MLIFLSIYLNIPGSDVVQLKDVVEFMTDPYFIANWKLFYNSLESPHPNFLQLEKWFAAGFKTFHEILMEILGHWVIANWGDASIAKLLEILRKDHFWKVVGNYVNKPNIS